MRLHHFQCFHCVKTDNVHKTRFQREITRFRASNVVFTENAFKRREMLVSALVSLICMIQCVCTIPSVFIASKPIMCIKRVISAK